MLKRIAAIGLLLAPLGSASAATIVILPEAGSMSAPTVIVDPRAPSDAPVLICASLAHLSAGSCTLQSRTATRR